MIKWFKNMDSDDKVMSVFIFLFFIIFTVSVGSAALVVSRESNTEMVSYNNESFEDTNGNVVPLEYVVMYRKVDGKIRVEWSTDGGYSSRYVWTNKDFIEFYLEWKNK